MAVSIWPCLVVMFFMFTQIQAASKSLNRKLADTIIIAEDDSGYSSSTSASGSNNYAVIFDAGSTGSRVHVFCFDQNLDLVRIGDGIEFYDQLKPGLSSYGADSQGAANSLKPLLAGAEGAVPQALHATTPLKLGATAGLRLLPSDQSDNIISAVRTLLENNSSFKSQDDWINILSGIQEGSYMWVAINYLLENLGKKYSSTVGVVDLGGGSVQVAYAISSKAAENAPNTPDGEDPYVKKLLLKGSDYYVYVHSYLNYGLQAARAEILKVQSTGNPCIFSGYNGTYTYGGVSYPVIASPYGSNVEKCRRIVLKALKIDEACEHPKCTFGGIWNGGGGRGQKNLYIASYFFDIASQAGLIDSGETTAKARPVDYKKAAERACRMRYENAVTAYPKAWDVEYICMDLVYQYTLLVDGFGLDRYQKITVVTEIEYKNSSIGAAWPLGSAVDVVSTLANKQSLYSFQ